MSWDACWGEMPKRLTRSDLRSTPCHRSRSSIQRRRRSTIGRFRLPTTSSSNWMDTIVSFIYDTRLTLRWATMAEINPDVTALLLARGLAEAFDRTSADGGVIQQDASMPPRLRRGLSLLSGLCLAAGIEDLGASVHIAMDRACEPFSTWGIAPFDVPFRYADVALIDRDLGIPTADCRELAALGGSEIIAQEDLHHSALRAAIQAFSVGQRDSAY